MKKINLDLKILILLWVLLILAILPTYAHHGNFLYDNGREAYYPAQMLLGNVLYKNIFNLYGPFAYLFNELLYKSFGINLNVLYFAGIVCSFLIITSTYIISRMFLSRILSFAIGFFTIAVGVVNLSLFNYIFPYSYAMIYGLVAFLFSVLFLLKYQKNPDRTGFLYLSSLFCGLAVANKYEFWAYSLVIIYAIFKFKRLNIKEYFLTISAFIVIPAICFEVLLYQGVTVSDLTNISLIIKKMFHSETLKFFYSQQGMYPTKGHIISIIKNSSLVLTSLALLICGFNLKDFKEISKKALGVFLIFSSIILLVVNTNPELLIFLPFLLFVMFLLRFKQILNDKASFILILSVYAFSLKNLFGIITLTYGLFYISFWVLTTLAIGFTHFKILQNKDKIVSLFLILISVLFIYFDLDFTTVDFSTKNVPLITDKGTFYMDDAGCKVLYKLFYYIKMTTNETDKVIVIPEGTFVNFITDRESDDYLNLLTPVMIETFGEDTIIERFKQVKPKYIIIHDNPMNSSYKINNICKDYAFKFCDFVKNDYYLATTIGVSNFNFWVYKIKR